MNHQVLCCFCNNSLEENIASKINIRIAPNEDEWQNLFAHNDCILKRIDKNIPFPISRILSLYDNETEKLIEEIEINIELLALQKIIGKEKFEDDIFLYKIYELNEGQISEVFRMENRNDKIDLKKYSYVLEVYT